MNSQEGELAKNLANYFVEQGVETSLITILTAYSGQLRYENNTVLNSFLEVML